MTPATLTDDLRRAGTSLRRCECGSAVVMAYEPGVTFIHCLREARTVATCPDWDPAGLAHTYNHQTPPPTP